MRRSTSVRTLRLFSALLLFAGSVSAPAPAGAEVIRRVAAGSEFLGRDVALSGNGRFLLRREESGDSVCGTVRFPTAPDIVVYDLQTSSAECITVNAAGAGVSGLRSSPSISADGQLVVFASSANSLDPRCSGGTFNAHVFLRNRVTQRTECISMTEARVPGNAPSVSPVIGNDGVPDIVTGTGPGGPPVVYVFSGAISTIFPNGRLYPKLLKLFTAYDAGFRGGVTVAVADVTGDANVDIITGAGPGGGPHVRVFQASPSTIGLPSISEYASFYAYNPAFLGGVRVAAGDLDGDGVSEILTAAGAGGSPHVEAFVLNAAHQPETVLSFYAYNPAFLGGVFVAAGDVDGDGREEVITGADAGGSPHVRVFGTGPPFTALREVYSFFAYEPGFTGGVRVAAGDLDGDGAAEIITAPGPWHAPLVRVFHTYANGALGEMSSFYAYARGSTAASSSRCRADGWCLVDRQLRP